jgi:altronate hydrolase
VLSDIVSLPAAENSAIRLHPADNVAVARVPIPAGAALLVDGVRVVARDAIPAGHKLAVAAIQPGEIVLRYGQPIGRASQPIAPGGHVHTHNLAFEALDRVYEFPSAELPLPEPRHTPWFLGYVRQDGRVGTRNYIAVVAASNCSAHAAERVAQSYAGVALPPNVDGVVAFPHPDGCGHAAGPDLDQLRRTVGGLLAHPNVSAAVIVGLGCEDNQIAHYLDSAARPASRLAGLTLQSSGGTPGAIQAARREIARFLEQAASERRAPAPLARIVLGLNCGGSDSLSGITANPALGHCCDLLVAAGATCVLAETPEIFGAEHLLVKRSRNRQVAEKLLACIQDYKHYLSRFEATFDDNPSPGNKAGGVTNILEKSLGAVAKGGASPLIDVYRYADPVTAPGLVFMDTPGYDPVSLSGLAAGGCNLIAFTTGRGSAIGFPTVPVVKIASNSGTYRRMTENMDLNAGAIADGGKTVEQMGREIFDLILEVASGRRTCAERLGHREFVPWRIGPVV